ADGAALAGVCDALVLGAGERPHCEAAIDAALAGGARVAITDGVDPTTVLTGPRDGAPAAELVVPVPAAPPPADDLRAAALIAAAFVIELGPGAPTAAATRFGHAAAAVRVRGSGAAAIGDRDAIEREAQRG